MSGIRTPSIILIWLELPEKVSINNNDYDHDNNNNIPLGNMSDKPA